MYDNIHQYYNTCVCYHVSTVFCCLCSCSDLCYNLDMSTYSGYTPSRKKANEKYLTEKVDNILIRVPKGKKAVIQDAAKQKNISLNQYIVDAIDHAIEQDHISGNDV